MGELGIIVESEESKNRRIGRDVLSKNRKSRTSILIFYYCSDLAVIALLSVYGFECENNAQL